MEQIITKIISRFGYAAIFILILLENVLPIVPSEIILTFAGLMSVKSHLSILTLFIIATNHIIYRAVNFILYLSFDFRRTSISFY